jgi:phage repressor protein C with HTH and peptisase S24 domain
MKSETARKVADALNVNRDWLECGDGPMRPGPQHSAPKQKVSPILQWDNPEDLPADDYVLVRQRLVRPSAGGGNLVFEEEAGPPLAFTTRWVQNEGLKHSDLVIVEVDGDSMEPSIRHGDSILVDTGNVEVQDGKVYVVRYRDELRVKRLFSRYDGALIIRSDNYNKFPEEVVPPQDLNGQVQVIGRVVWRAGGVV